MFQLANFHNVKKQTPLDPQFWQCKFKAKAETTLMELK